MNEPLEISTPLGDNIEVTKAYENYKLKLEGR